MRLSAYVYAIWNGMGPRRVVLDGPIRLRLRQTRDKETIPKLPSLAQKLSAVLRQFHPKSAFHERFADRT